MLWLYMDEVVLDGTMKPYYPVGKGGNKRYELRWIRYVSVWGTGTGPSPRGEKGGVRIQTLVRIGVRFNFRGCRESWE